MTDFHTTPVLVRQQRLAEVRRILKDNQLDALIIPSNDPHMSEYLPILW